MTTPHSVAHAEQDLGVAHDDGVVHVEVLAEQLVLAQVGDVEGAEEHHDLCSARFVSAGRGWLHLESVTVRRDSMRYSTNMPSMSALTRKERPGTVWTQFSAMLRIWGQYFQIAEEKNKPRLVWMHRIANVSFFADWSFFGLYLTCRVERDAFVASRRLIRDNCQSMNKIVTAVVRLVKVLRKFIVEELHCSSSGSVQQISLIIMAKHIPIRAARNRNEIRAIPIIDCLSYLSILKHRPSEVIIF